VIEAKTLGSVIIERCDVIVSPKEKKEAVANLIGLGDMKHPEEGNGKIPPRMMLERDLEPGVFFGGMGQFKSGHFVGMPMGTDGNILIVGGNGSGKSSGLIKPTLVTWGGAICATDVKGELTEYYRDYARTMLRNGRYVRPYIVFDPTCREGPSYDPFWWLKKGGEDNLVKNVWELVTILIPTQSEDPQPFWVKSEQGVFAAALLYFFRMGLSFSETVCKITEGPLSLLCEKLAERGDIVVKMFLGEMADPKKSDSKVVANIDRGLRNKLMLYATDPYISHALRGEREGAQCFTWDDLKHFNIFLRIPEDRVEQWGGVINLMYTQLLHYLECRPDKYSASSVYIDQTLLLMDEFARLGR